MDILFPNSLAEIERMLLTMGCKKADLSGVSARQDGARPAPGSHQRIAAVCASRIFPKHQVAVTEGGVVVCALSPRPRLKPGHWLAFAPEDPRRDFVDRHQPLSPAGTPVAVHVSEDLSGEEWELLARLLREKRLLALRSPAALLNLGRDILHLPKRFIADAAWYLREFSLERESNMRDFSIDVQDSHYYFLRLCRCSAAFWTTNPDYKDALSKATFTGVTLPELADAPWKLDDFPALFQALADRCAAQEFRERLSRPEGIGFTYESIRNGRSQVFTGSITFRNRRLCLNGTPLGREKLGYCLYTMQTCETPEEFDALMLRAARFSLKTLLAADKLPREIHVDNPWPFSIYTYMDAKTGRQGGWKSERASVACGGREKLTISSPADFLKIGNEEVALDLHFFAGDSRATEQTIQRRSMRLLSEFVAKHPDRLSLTRKRRDRVTLLVKGKLGDYIIEGDSEAVIVFSRDGRRICIEGAQKEEEKRMPLADRVLARAVALLNDDASRKRIHTLRTAVETASLAECQGRMETLRRWLTNNTLTEEQRNDIQGQLAAVEEVVARHHRERARERDTQRALLEELERLIAQRDGVNALLHLRHHSPEERSALEAEHREVLRRIDHISTELAEMTLRNAETATPNSNRIGRTRHPRADVIARQLYRQISEQLSEQGNRRRAIQRRLQDFDLTPEERARLRTEADEALVNDLRGQDRDNPQGGSGHETHR